MATDKRKPGRVTPKKAAAPPGRARRQPLLPKRVGPFERPDRNRPLGQVGRRPSSPTKLAVFAVVYIACGVASFFVIGKTLGLVLGIVLIGIGLLWARGAATAMLRHEHRQHEA